MTGVKRRICPDSDIHALYKELDEVSCPICMEHPHNAVLLLCSSHEKGCRSYICDTSYRHSNCLDRFKKLRDNPSDDSTLLGSLPAESFIANNNFETSSNFRTHISRSIRNQNFTGSSSIISTVMDERTVGQNTQDPSVEMRQGILEGLESLHERNEVEVEVVDMENLAETALSLKCPLCRGDILGWEVIEEARNYLNLKRRSCSRESCSFTGNYQDLRRHARRVHPTTRPSDVDPSRERAWRHLERQRDYGDVVSAIRSAIPGAVVVGDFVIENGDRFSLGSDRVAGEGNAPWWTTLFLFQMIGSVDGGAEPRARSRGWERHRRPPGALPEWRRFLWGENLLGLQDDDEYEDNEYLHVLSDIGEDASPVPRRRRRLNRPRSDDQSDDQS